MHVLSRRLLGQKKEPPPWGVYQPNGSLPSQGRYIRSRQIRISSRMTRPSRHQRCSDSYSR